MEICVTDAEYGLLAEILQERHIALLHEISHTDHHDFKKMLKQRNELLGHLMGKPEPRARPRPRWVP